MELNVTNVFTSPFSSEKFSVSPITIFLLTFFSTYVAKTVIWPSIKKVDISNLLKRTGFGVFIGSPQEVLETVMEELDKAEPTPYTFWLAYIRYVVVAKPEDLQVVLNSSHSLEKSSMYRFFINTVGEGLFSAPVEKWKKHRRIITPAFNMRLIESFFPYFNQKNCNLISQLKKEAIRGMELDLYGHISFNSLDIICQTMLGYDINSLESAKVEFENALKMASVADSMRIYKPWLHPEFIFKLYTKHTGLDEAYKNLHKLPSNIIKEKQMKLQAEKASQGGTRGNTAPSFLDMLLELNELGAEFSDDDIRDEVITMMVGGSETSALAISSTLLMLAMHPKIQEEVYKEVHSIIGDEKRPINMDDVNRMIYTEQCIREALRLFPPGALILRRATDNITLKNDFVIPAGANILISSLKTQRDPRLYPSPLVYNPENFSSGAMKTRHKFSFIAFSGGPRGCIGSKYAMLSMKITIAMIIRNFHLTTSMRYEDLKLELDLLMRIVGGYRMKIYSRD